MDEIKDKRIRLATELISDDINKEVIAISTGLTFEEIEELMNKMK